MKGQHVGYVRVSSIGQNTDRQLADIELDEVFEEKASAKSTVDRPVLAQCLKHVRKGDVLHVHSIDRLARNLAELQSLIDGLVQRGVSVHFHKENLLFSGTADPMQRLMLQMMGAFAEFERSLIRERQREGIAQARKAGKQIGRARSLTPEQVREIKERLARGETKASVAAAFGISRPTLYAALS
jgi:DNA invertase Pin-like site-specific DNA recombinase